VNALYYNIADFSILDYTHGMQDLNNKLLRMIGNPEQRFHEDPVRLLRATRFVGKLNLKISPETEASMMELSHLLQHVSPARLFQEILKFFHEGATLSTFKLFKSFHFFEELFPQTAHLLSEPYTSKLIEEGLANTDLRIAEGKPISPAFLFSVFLWYPITQLIKQYRDDDLPPHIIFEKAIRDALKKQIEKLTIPRNLSASIHDICFLQHRLTCLYGNAPLRLLDHPRFRAAYDLLLLRAHIGEPIQELATWWMRFYAGNAEQREELLKELRESKSAPKKRRRSSRHGRRKKTPKKIMPNLN
jgi:poly(A) polymerase